MIFTGMTVTSVFKSLFVNPANYQHLFPDSERVDHKSRPRVQKISNMEEIAPEYDLVVLGTGIRQMLKLSLQLLDR